MGVKIEEVASVGQLTEVLTLCHTFHPLVAIGVCKVLQREPTVPCVGHGAFIAGLAGFEGRGVVKLQDCFILNHIAHRSTIPLNTVPVYRTRHIDRELADLLAPGALQGGRRVRNRNGILAFCAGIALSAYINISLENTLTKYDD